MNETENMDTEAENLEPEVMDPGLELAIKAFTLKHPVEALGVDKAKLKDEIMETLVAGARSSTYEKYCESLGWMLDEKLLGEMKTKNDEELKQLDLKITDAVDNLGDSEVREAMLAKAEFFARIGKREEALAAYETTEKKTVAVGQKMDLIFSVLRLSLIAQDYTAVKDGVEKAKKMFEQGGDWERKNRLKVYEGLYFMAIREFKKAAMLFLDSIATFTTYELFSYQTFVFYTVVTAIISLDRVTLKTKVVDAPEILTVIDGIPGLSQFLNSLYNCEYLNFFKGFCTVCDHVKLDVYLHPHFRYFMRQVRVVAYTQFLESYKSVTLQSMATAFGMSPEFLDTELSRFISSGRLNCKIDKVSGIIETNRPDAKNALYQKTIKTGDLLLNRLQKLSKVIDL